MPWKQLNSIVGDLFLANAHRIFVTGPNNARGAGRTIAVTCGRKASESIDCVAGRESCFDDLRRCPPGYRFLHSALRVPKESASEREGFIIQASA